VGARAIAAAAALIVTAGSAHAAEIDAMITTAMKAAVDELAPPFERANGHVLRITYGPSGGLARRLNAGEAADLVVVDSKALDELIKQGKVVGGRTDVAHGRVREARHRRRGDAEGQARGRRPQRPRQRAGLKR
jgi:molybdate transport system substrate-binding protein